MINLYSYDTGTLLREATDDEAAASRAACSNGFRLGVIAVDGALCLTDEHEVQRQHLEMLQN